MKILVCFKYVRDENEIKTNPDRTLCTDSAPWTISPYDTIAMEAGMRLAAELGNSSVEVLTAGGEEVENSKMKKAVLSRGPSKMYAVTSDCSGDLLATSLLLNQAIERIGDVDVIICGDGSADMYSQVLGTMLGAEMAIPTLNSVSELSVENGRIMASRISGNHTEKYAVSTPVLISVTSDICRALIPSMKDILGTGKKPVEIWDESEFDSCCTAVQTISVLAPESTDRIQQTFKSDDAGIEQFVKYLRENLKGVM